MILVTGATGTVGRPLVRQMLERGEKIRVLTRDAGKLAELEDRVQVAEGDLSKPAEVEKALHGIDRVFLVTSSSAQDQTVIAAARATGTHHLVKLSTLEAGHEPMIGHGKFHREREELIRASGLEWTFLRPTMFSSTALDWAPAIKAQSAVYYPGGDGGVSPIDPWDIAAVAAEALTGAGHVGQAYALTGPKVISVRQMVETLGRVLGKPLSYVDVDNAAAAEQMRGAGLPEYTIKGLIEAFDAVRGGRFSYVTDTVEQITHRRPRSFEEWCREHVEAFR